MVFSFPIILFIFFLLRFFQCFLHLGLVQICRLICFSIQFGSIQHGIRCKSTTTFGGTTCRRFEHTTGLRQGRRANLTRSILHFIGFVVGQPSFWSSTVRHFNQGMIIGIPPLHGSLVQITTPHCRVPIDKNVLFVFAGDGFSFNFLAIDPTSILTVFYLGCCNTEA